jgi:hypothetical protein
MERISEEHHPCNFESRIKMGRHCAIFAEGGSLYLELDGELCNSLGPRELVGHIAGAMDDFGTNHPTIARIAAAVHSFLVRPSVASGGGSAIGGAIGAAIGWLAGAKKGSTAGVVILARFFSKAAAGGYGVAGTVFTAAGIVLLYLLIHLIVRWSALVLNHKASVSGGVIIEYPPPYWPVLLVPQIWPRGGYKDRKFGEARGLPPSALGDNLADRAAGARDAVRGLRPALASRAAPKLPLRRR